MQNVHNAAEIQQRVKNLVNLYRTKVGKESKKAKDLAEEYKRQYDAEIDFAYSLHEQGIEGYCLDIRIPEEDVDAIRANEQLLGYFYKEVAGDNVDSDVLSYFLAEKYDPSFFTDEEDSFLKSHFTEMVNYIIETPNNDLQAVEYDDRNDINLLPKEVLNLVKERFTIPTGSKVYNPFTGFAQLACLYEDCSFFCEESYMSFYKRWNAHCDKLRETEHIIESKVDENKLHAWMKVALYANNIDAFVIKDGSIPQNYDAVVSYIPYIPSAIPNLLPVMGDEPSDPDIINKIVSAYQNLANGGKMFLIIPTEYLWEKKVIATGEKKVYSLELEALWKQLIDDNSLVEVIQLPSVMGKSFYKEEHCIVIVEKGCERKNVSFMDARFASLKSDGKLFKQTLDLDALHTMIENGGKENNTGLRKYVQIPKTEINSDLLVPQVYVLEKPSEYDAPVPLTELCSLGMAHIYDVKENLPEDTPWVESGNLSTTFRGALDLSSLEKAGCPNNPEGWKYGNRKLSKFGLFAVGNEYTNEDIHISNYRNCRYIDGSQDAVLFRLSKEGIATALINAAGKAIAVSPDIHVLYPNPQIDALSLLAIINLPIVYRQISVFEQFGLYGAYGHLREILVPTEKSIIIDEIQRLVKDGEIISELREKLNNQKKSVRMRKHALTQSLSSLEAMFYALNAFRERNAGHLADDDVISRIKGTTVSEAFEYISKGIKDMMPVLEHIADVEYTFAMEEWIDPEKFMEDYIARNENGWLNFKPIITWEKGNNQAKSDGYAFTNTQPSRRELALKKGQSIRQFLFPKDALEHIFKNIISNAQSWAFNDKSREDYQLKFSWHIGGEGKTLVIEIENNGTPIPEDRDTASLLEYGVSTSLHHDGHNGIGCNEIDDIMQRYDGKVEIVSTPQSTFTVKYVLTFNNIDDMGSKYKVIKPVDF